LALGGALLGGPRRTRLTLVLGATALAELLGGELLLGLRRRGGLLGSSLLRSELLGRGLGGLVLFLFGCHHFRFLLSSLLTSIPRSRATVSRRATLRRDSRRAAVFSSSPVACRKRRLNASWRASRSASTRSWSVIA